MCIHPTQMSHAVKKNKCGYPVHDVCLSSTQHEIEKKSTKHVLLSCIWLGNCNCNLFAVHKSKLGYSPVDIDFVTYMPPNIIYT